MLATNIAETSVTIDGMRFVIDSGAVKGRLLHERLAEPDSAGRGTRLASGSSISVEQLSFATLTADQPAPLLISAGGDARLRCWDANTLRLLFVFPLLPPGGACCGADPITVVRWNQDSATLAVGDAVGRVAMWDGSRLEAVLNSSKAIDGPGRSGSYGTKAPVDPQEVCAPSDDPFTLLPLLT